MIADEVCENKDEVDYRRIILLGELVDYPILTYRPSTLKPVTRFVIQENMERRIVEYKVKTIGALALWCRDYLRKESYVRIEGRIIKYNQIKADTVEEINGCW